MGACCCCCADKGEQPSLNSPVKKRRCTDVHCFIVFFLYWAGMIGILAYTILFGRVQRLLNGFDDYGNTCGIDNKDADLAMITNITYVNQNMTDRPYQFFMNYYNIEKSYSICVKQCPHVPLESYTAVKNYAVTNETLLCDYSVAVKDYESIKECHLMDIPGCYGPCPALNVPVERPLLNRCVPSAAIDDPIGFALNGSVFNSLTDFFGQYRFFNELGSSFYMVRYEILILLATALGIALLLVFLMRFVIKIVVWFIVILAAVAAIAGTVFLWITWAEINKGINKQERAEHKIPILRIAVDAWTAYLVYSITATVLTAILLLVILVMRKRLQLAVALFQEAGKVLENSPLLLIQPCWTFIFQIGILILGVIMLILCAGVTTPEQAIREDGSKVIKLYDRDIVTYFWWYIVIGIVWTAEFASAIQELIIAGTVAEWYFTRLFSALSSSFHIFMSFLFSLSQFRNKKDLSCTVCSATGRTLLYHLGSAAFGSFLITLIKIPRYILMKINSKLESNKTSECAKFMLKCCICCLYCLEKCMKYINRNAYIVIAISSTDFCVARVKAFKVLLSNVLRVLAINTVGDFVLFLGKILVMSANIVIAFFLFDRKNEGVMYGERSFFFLPTLAIAIYSYLIAHCFLSSFEMLVDTLLLCFCEDVKLNDGSEEKPYYMSKTLMKFIGKSSKALNKERKRNTDEVDGMTLSERNVLASGDDSKTVSAEDVRLTAN